MKLGRATISLCLLLLAAACAERERAPIEKTQAVYIEPLTPGEGAQASAPPAPQVILPGFALEIPAFPDQVPTSPPRVDTERYPDAKTNPVKRVADEPVSTFSIDVDTAAYANVRRFLREGRLPPTDAVRIEELINYFDYDYAPPSSRDTPFATHVELAPSPWSDQKLLMRTAIQGYDFNRNARPPINLTLLVDVSGSMQDENKLPLAKKALGMLIEEMRPQDRIAVAVYAGAAGEVLPPTSGANKAAILAALDKLSAGGSTAGGEGLMLAYSLAEKSFNKEGVNRVMLLSDGDFNVGISDPQRLEDFVARKRDTGIYLSILGFGGGNYNDVMMQTLAQSGNGVAAYIDTVNEARKVLVEDLSGSMFPIANDVKIQVEFNPAVVAEYRLIGYETRLLNEADFNNDKVDAGDIGAGASVTALYELSLVGSADRLMPDRRYGSQTGAKTEAKATGEFAFLKLRYKRPGESASILIERPIVAADMRSSIEAASPSMRWATAVAGYGQLLRKDPYIKTGFGHDQVIALAKGTKLSDRFGYHAEFLELAAAARSARAQ